MTKRKNKSNKKNIPFIVITGLLGISILIPIILLIISTFMNNKATEEFTKSLYPVKYEKYVEKAAEEFNVDVCLVYGVILTESNFNPDAVSSVGAVGLMQIMPDTFTWLQNYRTDFLPDTLMNSDKLYNPQINIEYGTYFLSYLLEKYEGDKSLAICAYNAGYGNVDAWLADGTIPNGDVSPEDIPFTETSNYLSKVTEAMEMYRELYFSKLESYPDGTLSVLTTNNDNTDSIDWNSEYSQSESENRDYDSTYLDGNIDDNYIYDNNNEEIDDYNYEYNYEY